MNHFIESSPKNGSLCCFHHEFQVFPLQNRHTEFYQQCLLVKIGRVGLKNIISHLVLRRNMVKRKQRAESIEDSATMSAATRTRVRIAVFSCRKTTRKHQLLLSLPTSLNAQTLPKWQRFFLDFVFINTCYYKNGEPKFSR